MSDTAPQDDAYAAFSEAFQQRSPVPRAVIQGDPDSSRFPDLPASDDADLDAPDVDDSAPPESPPTEPVLTEPPSPDSTTPPAPDALPPTPAPAPLNIGGREYDIATVEQYLNIVNRLAALPVAQREAIDHLISTGQFPTPPSPTVAPVESPVDEYLDPRAAADIKALRDQVASLKESQASFAQASNQSDLERLNTVVNSAITDFATTHSLSAAEAQQLAQEAARLQIGPALLEQHRGDYHASTLNALEVAMYTLPDFRDKAIAAQVQTKVDTAIADINAREAKKVKAGALAGSPTGSVSRDTVAPRPGNRQEQIDAMASVIREAQSNGVPS